MPRAIRVFTSFGEMLTTDLDCCSGDEISSVPVVVPLGTICDICEEEILDEPATTGEAGGENG